VETGNWLLTTDHWLLTQPSKKEEKMEENKRIIGTISLSFSIFCLALAVGYFGYELNGWRKQLPEILTAVSDTSGQISPVLENVKEIEGLVPQVIQEVAEVRKTVDNVLSEAEKTRKAVPKILADVEKVSGQIDSTVKRLPDIIDPILKETEKTRILIPDVLEQVRATNNEVAKVRELVPPILEEVRITREELPLLMDRADQLVAGADEAGRKAGKGAMTGMIGGILSMPFDVVGGIGKGFTSLFGAEVGEAMNEEDLKLFREKIIGLAENGKEGDIATWKNPKTSVAGKLTLVEKYREKNQECRKVKVEMSIKGGTPQTKTLAGCKQPDGSWLANQ
jgi:surface antigen